MQLHSRFQQKLNTTICKITGSNSPFASTAEITYECNSVSRIVTRLSQKRSEVQVFSGQIGQCSLRLVTATAFVQKLCCPNTRTRRQAPLGANSLHA